jgi:antirestriction protein
MAQFYLNPYDISKSGLYFDTSDVERGVLDLDDALEQAIKGQFEEYSVELIDAPLKEAEVWQAVTLHHGDSYPAIRVWLEVLEEDDYDLPGVYWAMSDKGFSEVDEAKTYGEDAMVREGTIRDLADEFIADDPASWAENYFDYEALARDMAINQELPEEAYDEDGAQVWSDQEAEEYAEELVESTGVEGIGNLEYYIDEDKVARDLEFDYSEFEFGGTTYTAHDH